MRIPDNNIVKALLTELDEPIASTSLMMPGSDEPLYDPLEMRKQLEHQVDLIIDGGYCGIEPTSVVDLSGDEPKVLRVGKGDVSEF